MSGNHFNREGRENREKMYIHGIVLALPGDPLNRKSRKPERQSFGREERR
jgi:hypothetical protein